MSLDHYQDWTLPGAAAGGGDPQAYLNADARAGTGDNGKPSDTIDQAAWQLIRGEPGWSRALGQAFTVSYAYRATAPGTMPQDATGFERFNAAQINQAELALKAWSDVANIRFVRVGVGTLGEGAYSDNAAILLGDYTSGVKGAAAFTFFPGSTSSTSSSGDVWVNSSLGYNAQPMIGNYGAEVLVHELGHAIGLEHPSDYDASADSTLSYAANASYYEDSRQYTLMSYFSESNTGANFGGVYPAAPMLDDIAAAQLEYGANMSTRTGDTVYGFHANADEPWFVANSSASRLVFAVWDASGKDTLDFSGYGQNQLIDLRQGFFSNVGGLVGNVTIAKGAVIENAIGGDGSDVLQGNDAGNQLSGGFGADTLRGGSGPNTLRGGEGSDSIVGGAGFNDVNGNQGADTLINSSGVGAWLRGGQGDDRIENRGAHAIVNGDLGDDVVIGGGAGDTLRGGQGYDSITGGAGADWISGDRGGDTVSGGGGADTFHASVGAGPDFVTDFNAGQGDRIQLDWGVSWHVDAAGADVIVSYGGSGDQIILQNVSMSSLPPGFIMLV